MVNTSQWLNGSFRQTSLNNESPDYLAKCEELRIAEIELMRWTDHAAELRSHLPQRRRLLAMREMPHSQSP